MKLQVKLFGLVAALGILAACSGNPSVESKVPGIPSDPLTGFSQSQAAENKNELLSLMSDLRDLIGPGGVTTTTAATAYAGWIEAQSPLVSRLVRQAGQGEAVQSQVTQACKDGGNVTQTPDEPEDKDDDNIFASLQAWANNCLESGVTTNGLILGMLDKDDNSSVSGFTVASDLTMSTSSASLRTALGFDYTPVATGAFSIRLGFLIAGGANKIAYGLNWSYTPKSDSNSDPYDNGFTSFNGRFVYKVSTGENAGNYVLDMKGENLEHSSSCTSTFVSGKATFQDNAGNKLVIQYTGCNSYTVTYNGNPI